VRNPSINAASPSTIGEIKKLLIGRSIGRIELVIVSTAVRLEGSGADHLGLGHSPEI
jgi:hypothetical protein